MKVNNCNLIGFNPKFNNNILIDNKPADNNNFDYNKMLHPQEVLGRSIVNFTGLNKEKFELCDDDKKFINSTSQNLRLSEEDKQKLTSFITSFLKEKDYLTLDYLDDEDYESKTASGVQVQFLNEACDKMKFSDFDLEIFAADLTERIYYYMTDEEYLPENRKYEKDFEVVEDIFDKYNIDMMQKYEIFDVMKLESQTMGYETVFDIFKPENRSKHSITKNYLNEQFNSDTVMDMFIDLGSTAKKDVKTRHNAINKTKISDKFYNNQTNLNIFEALADKFDLDEELQEEIISKIEKRDTENKDVKQIAFELADEYDLPSKAEEFIRIVIMTADTIRNATKEKYQ